MHTFLGAKVLLFFRIKKYFCDFFSFFCQEREKNLYKHMNFFC